MEWLSGWAKRVKLTSDSGVIDADLTDFPALLYISATSGKNAKDLTFVFDEIGANRKKIAVTKSDGTTQCYVEIVKWDAVGEEAWLFAKHPTLDADADEEYYLYFDNSQPDNTTYVGDPGSTPAQNVWDSNFKLVTHMRDDPDTSHVRDSTVNANDGTKKAAGEPAVTTAGKIDDAQDFDGANDYINLGQPASLDFSALDSFTISLFTRLDVTPSDYEQILGTYQGSDPGVARLIFITANKDTGYAECQVRDKDRQRTVVTGSTNISGIWHHLVLVWSGTTKTLEVYQDSYSIGSQTNTSISGSLVASDWFIGSRNGTVYFFDGIIDEVRISNVARSAAWVKASYHSGNDSLWTWGDEETAPVVPVGKPPMTLMGV